MDGGGSHGQDASFHLTMQGQGNIIVGADGKLRERRSLTGQRLRGRLVIGPDGTVRKLRGLTGVAYGGEIVMGADGVPRQTRVLPGRANYE